MILMLDVKKVTMEFFFFLGIGEMTRTVFILCASNFWIILLCVRIYFSYLNTYNFNHERLFGGRVIVKKKKKVFTILNKGQNLVYLKISLSCRNKRWNLTTVNCLKTPIIHNIQQKLVLQP